MLVLFQDYRKRMIHLFLPVVVFLLGLLINYSSESLELVSIVYNCSFILVNFTGLVLYFSIKDRSFANPIDTQIGLGDLVFFVAITPLFNLKTFVLFFVFGLVFSLLLHATMLVFKKVKTIPLAGYLSLFLVLNIVVKDLLKINTLI